MKLQSLILVGSLLGGPSIFADEVPPTGSVGIESLSYHGTGCPAGSAVANISPDNLAMTMLFDQYILESESRGRQKIDCTVDIKLKTPPGWSYALFCVDFRGYAALDRSVYAFQNTSYKFGQSRLRRLGRHTIRGPFDNDYAELQQISVQAAPHSNCGDDTLTLKTDMEIRNYSRNGLGLMTVDSIDGHLKQHYGLVWRKCEPAPEPDPNRTSISVSDISRSKTLGTGADGAQYKVENFGGACYKATRNGSPITPCEHGFAFILGAKYIAATSGAAGKLYDLTGQRVSPARNFHSVSCDQTGQGFDCTAKVGATKFSFPLGGQGNPGGGNPGGGNPGNVSSDQVSVGQMSRDPDLGQGADGLTYQVQNFGGACWKVVRNGAALTPCEHGFKLFMGGKFIAAAQGAAGKLYNLDGMKVSPDTFHSVSCRQQGQSSQFECESKVGARKRSFSISY